MIARAILMGAAKPIPMLPPAGKRIAVLIPDKFAPEINERTTRVARIDRCIDSN
jgi:hypothetical protein